MRHYLSLYCYHRVSEPNHADINEELVYVFFFLRLVCFHSQDAC